MINNLNMAFERKTFVLILIVFAVFTTMFELSDAKMKKKTKIDTKRSIALPVKSVKKTSNGPSYIADLRVLNAKEMTLACSVCRSYANHVKKQLKESSKSKPVDMEVTVGWRMDERKKINYHTSDSHLLDIFDNQQVCKTYKTTDTMDQCDKYGLCTPVPIKLT